MTAEEKKTRAVGLTDDTYRVVTAVAAAEKISRMEVVRRGVEAYIAVKALEDAVYKTKLEVRA